jgi:hypothetical protein
MRALFPVVINITAVILGRLLMTFRNEKTGTQTQGEAVKTDTPCPNGVSE